MMILKINDHSLMIKDPKTMMDLRTPCTIDVSSMSLKEIKKLIKSYGLCNYVLDDTKKEIVKDEKKSVVVSHDDFLNERLDNIELLLKKLLDKNTNPVIIERDNYKVSETFNKPSKVKEIDEEKFIPSFEMNAVSSKTTTVEKVEVRREDIDLVAQMLKNMSK
jgi:dihydroxyacetone kinase-like predicted kinase